MGHTHLGQLAALPEKSLVARVGQSGFRLQAEARGESSHLLVPTDEPADAALCETIELEHPVELLEPLLFLLSHMLEQVTERAAQRALAIASVETCLVLDGNALEGLPEANILDGARRRVHRRTVRPALPERDRHTLLKLIQLDLELHPPDAAVIALRMEAHPARPQRAQQGLFAAQAPEAGRLEILLARLRRLVGEGHVGAPELLDSHAPEAFRVANLKLARLYRPSNGANSSAIIHSKSSRGLRMVRPPHAVAVELRGRDASAMHYEGQRLTVQTRFRPMANQRSMVDASSLVPRRVGCGAAGSTPQRCLRLAYDPGANCWYLIGIYD